MKLVTIALCCSIAFVSNESNASNNTYVYSNTEYCALAADNSTDAHLDAYGRKLGFKPTAQQCRQLLIRHQPQLAAVSARNVSERNMSERNVQQLLKQTLRGSTIRPTARLSRMMNLLPENERQQVLNELLGR